MKVMHESCPDENHGDEKNLWMQCNDDAQSLREKGCNLIFLNKKGKFSKSSRRKWCKIVSRSKIKKMITIGVVLGAKKGSYHCIARTNVGGEYYFVELVNYRYWESTEHSLEAYFSRVEGVYCITESNQ